jgi:hypothetical protein
MFNFFPFLPSLSVTACKLIQRPRSKMLRSGECTSCFFEDDFGFYCGAVELLHELRAATAGVARNSVTLDVNNFSHGIIARILGTKPNAGTIQRPKIHPSPPQGCGRDSTEFVSGFCPREVALYFLSKLLRVHLFYSSHDTRRPLRGLE